MRTNFLKFIFFLLFSVNGFSQKNNNFISGETLEYRISFKIFDAAYTSLRITEDKNNNTFNVEGYGKSTGTLRFFCAVDDRFNVTFDNKTFKPIKIIKNISECGYVNNMYSKFNFDKKEIEVFDKDKNTTKKFAISDITKDLITSFYYFRNLDHKKIKTGDVIKAEFYFDERILPTEIKILGREIIKTKFGKIQVLKTKPIVETGRIFSKTDGVYTWISDDENLVPLKTVSELRVGKITVYLDKYKNLKVPFKIINN